MERKNSYDIIVIKALSKTDSDAFIYILMQASKHRLKIRMTF